MKGERSASRMKSGLVLFLAIGVLALSSPSRAVEPVVVAQLSHIHGIAFDPADSSGLLIATHHGIYRASIGNVIEQVSGDRNDYMGFVPHPTDPNVLFASGHPEAGGNMGFISSNDGGATWTRVSPGYGGPVDFHAIVASRADPQVMCGLYGGIQITTDGGASWSRAGQGSERVIDLAVSPADASILYAGTASGVMVSRDRGASWHAASGLAEPAILVEFAPDGSMLAYFVPSGLHRAAPGGDAFVPVALAPDILLHLAVHPTNPQHLVAVTRNSVLLQSHDGGASWADLVL